MTRRSATHVEQRYAGAKVCCDFCGKVVFPDRGPATDAARTITARAKERFYPYLGRCGWWHVTRRRPKGWNQ